MKKTTAWSFALIVSLTIGYFPFISEYTSQKLLFGIPLYFIMVIIQTFAVLFLLTYAGVKKGVIIDKKEKRND